jgi:hypothetical protein
MNTIEGAHHLHQVVGLLGRQDRRGLVEDQHLRVADQRLEDLHALLHADRKVLDQRVDRHVQPVARGDLLDLAARAATIQEPEPLGALVAELDVLRDGEHRDQHEVLVHHPDAGRHRVAGAGEPHRHVIDQDLALVGLIEPVEGVHQGALAGSVLAEQCVDLTGLDDQVDGVVRGQRAEPFGDAAQLQLHERPLSKPRVLTLVVLPDRQSTTCLPRAATGEHQQPGAPLFPVLRFSARRNWSLRLAR